MMRRIFIIKVILLSLVSARAQTVDPDTLLGYEQAWFHATDPVLKESILLKKINYYLEHNCTDTRILKELIRVNYKLVQDNKIKNNFLWNAALIAYLNNETGHAGNYLSHYALSSGDSSLQFNLLSLLINKYSDTTEARKRINLLSEKDSLFKTLNCFYQVSNYNRKHFNLYLISSAILPGSGTMMNGEIIKGVISLSLAAASVYGIIRLVQYTLYINAALWGTGVGLKFYTGNFKLTEQSFYKAEARKKNKLAGNCELNLKKILEKYPLTLKQI